MPGWACVVPLFPVLPRLTSRTAIRIIEPFWCAAEEAGLPISMHIFCGSTPDMGLPARWIPGTGIVGYTMAHGGIVATLGQLICGGVAARHPDLKFVCAEFETGWLGHVLQRLNHATYRARGEASPDIHHGTQRVLSTPVLRDL